jgi:hypothetical protein
MYNANLINAGSQFARKLIAIAALVLIAASFVATGAAHADSKQGSGGPAGCQIENDGHVETVEVGTKIGLFTCGEDGEWHFGWLINSVSLQTSKTLKPVTTVPPRNGILQVAKISKASKLSKASQLVQVSR